MVGFGKMIQYNLTTGLDSLFELVAYIDSDYAGASLDRKSTTGGCQFLGSRLISWQCKKQIVVATSTTEAEYVAAATNLEFYDKHKMVAYLKKPIGSEGYQETIDFLNGSHIRTVDNEEQEITATVNEEGEGSGHPSEPQPPLSTAQLTNEEPIPNVASSSHQKTQTPRQALYKVIELPQTSEPISNVADEAVYEEWDDIVERAATTAASLDAEQATGAKKPWGVSLLRLCLRGYLTMFERVPTPSYDLPVLGVHTPGSDEERFKQHELTGNVQQQSNDPPLSKGHTLRKNLDEDDPSKQEMSMIEEIDHDAVVTLVQINAEDQGKVTLTQVSAQGEAHSQEYQPEDHGGISTASRLFSTAEESVSTTGASMPVSTAGMVQRVNISIPSPVAVKDKELAQRLQAEEMNKYSEVDQAKMLVDLINQRKRYFTAQKAEAKRNKPMTQAQQRAYMSTYIKNVGSYTLNQLKKLTFDEIKKLFETTMKIINTFVPIKTDVRGRASELAVGSSQATIIDYAEVRSSKRAVEAELNYKGSKRQKINEASGSEQPDKEENELLQEDLQQMMMVVSVEEVYVEALQYYEVTPPEHHIPLRPILGALHLSRKRFVEMSRDVLTVGSTMRIPLLYRGEDSQWVERFMNYLEEQTDGEAMINSIKNGDQPLPRVTQVSIAGTTSTEQPPLKDKSMWSDQEKRIQKIDRLARSLLIQGHPNDIYSLIDSNKTSKDLWDALARHMLGLEYGEQDRKAVILYEYETFKATEGELLLDTYIRYLQVINDLKKCGYSKDNYELNFKFLNNLQPEWKKYATMTRQNKNLMDINIDALYNILKQNQGDVNDAMGSKKKLL
nr:integrase, catalytic region, zinc finger, CCHC-type, peptidase aspartic, catalytic [Tanacetum cinerariifolium]